MNSEEGAGAGHGEPLWHVERPLVPEGQLAYFYWGRRPAAGLRAAGVDGTA